MESDDSNTASSPQTPPPSVGFGFEQSTPPSPPRRGRSRGRINLLPRLRLDGNDDVSLRFVASREIYLIAFVLPLPLPGHPINIILILYYYYIIF